MELSKEQRSFGFLFLLILVLSASVVWLFFSLKKDSVKNRLRSDEVLVRVLVVLDDGQGSALCTEMFMYNPENGKGAILEIPGNMGSIFEDSLGRVDRVDMIYKEKGLEVYKGELESFISGSRKKQDFIPFTLCFTIDDFCAMADLFGGLSIFVPSPVDVTDEEGQRYLLPSGAVVLDGDKVRSYMMYMLKDETEAERDERRHNAMLSFLFALRDHRDLFLNKQNFERFRSHFETDLDSEGEYELFNQICSVDPDKLIRNTVKGEYRNVYVEERSENVRLLFPENSGKLLRQTVNLSASSLVLTESFPEGRSYVVEVLNGTMRNRLAEETGSRLKSAGYDVLHVANAGQEYEETVIINHIGDVNAAKVLGDFIGCKNIQVEKLTEDTSDSSTQESDNTSKYDFTIILGRDF